MRTLKSLMLAAVGCVFIAGSLTAQTAGSVEWKGVNGAWSGYATSSGGANAEYVYTSPYRAAFEIPTNSPASMLLPPSGTTGFGPTEDIFCVDFTHSANTGSYSAWFTNLGTDPLSKTRSSTLSNYLEAAFLAQQIEHYGSNAVYADSVADLNGAIWLIMNGTPTYRQQGAGWTNVGINAWKSLAVSNWSGGKETGVSASNWVVVSSAAATGTGSSQEYITQVTPEPATMLLLGTGLLIMMFGAGAVKRLSA